MAEKTNTSVTRLDLALLVIVVVFLFLLMFKLPLTPFYIEDDHLIFLDNAARMVNGERIYTDFFQFTFPGGQLWYASFFLLFGINYWVLNISIVAIWTSVFWISLRISKFAIDGPFAYLPPLVLIFFGVRWLGLEGSHRTLSPIFIWLAVLVLIRSRGNWSLVAAGFFCASASFVTQQRGLAAIFGIGLFFAIELFAKRETLKTFAQKTAILGGSFLLSLAAMFAYFINYAGIGEIFAATLMYPARYYHFDKSNNPGVFLIHLRSAFGPDALLLEWMPAVFYAFGVPLALVVFFAVHLAKRKGHDAQANSISLLLGCVGLALVAATTAPSQLRYFPIAVPSLILMFVMLRRVGFIARYERSLTLWAAVALISLGVIWSVRIQMNSEYETFSFPRGTVAVKPDRAFERYVWLRDRTTPGEPAFEAAWPYVYFLLDLKNSSRYSQFFPTEYTRPEFVAGAVDDLQRSRPRFILWNNDYNIPNAERRQGDHLGPLAELVHRDYEPTAFSYNSGGGSITIWQLRRAISDEPNAKHP